MISLIWASLMPSHQRRSSSRRQGRVGETSADRLDQDRPVTLNSLNPGYTHIYIKTGGGMRQVGGGGGLGVLWVCSCVFVPESLVSRQLSCLLASGVQDRSRELG